MSDAGPGMCEPPGEWEFSSLVPGGSEGETALPPPLPAFVIRNLRKVGWGGGALLKASLSFSGSQL